MKNCCKQWHKDLTIILLKNTTNTYALRNAMLHLGWIHYWTRLFCGSCIACFSLLSQCMCVCVAVVDRLKCFLPEMAAANAKLDQQMQQSPEACDIENISKSDERVIEMVRCL